MKTYEGMFLFDPTVVHEWDNIEAEVRWDWDPILFI